MPKSVSIFIPSYNEEHNINSAIKSVVDAVSSIVLDYEIIIVDDGSFDHTLSIIKRVASKNKHIKYIHHAENLGLGRSFQDAIKISKKTYITVFPGDNDMSGDSLTKICQEMNTADLIITYPENQNKRLFLRRFISCSFTRVMNLIFGLHLKYYNGSFITKLELVKNLPFKTNGFLIYAELKLRLIRKGCAYTEISFTHVGRKHDASKAVSWHSLFDTIKSIIGLAIDPTL